MQHYKNNFDDNCKELTLLRWLRDNIVSIEDTNHYYRISPIIVESILSKPNSKEILGVIYNDIIRPCVKTIEQENYDIAYEIYKNGFLVLENQFAKTIIQERFIRILKQIK